mgnify:CR=1 FL=1
MDEGKKERGRSLIAEEEEEEEEEAVAGASIVGGNPKLQKKERAEKEQRDTEAEQSAAKNRGKILSLHSRTGYIHYIDGLLTETR